MQQFLLRSGPPLVSMLYDLLKMRDLDPTVDSSEIRRTGWKGKFIRLFTGIYIQGFKNIPGGDRRISSIVLIFKCFFVIPRFWGLFSTLRTMVIALCVHFGCLHEGGLGNESFVEIKMARGNNEKESLYIPGTHVPIYTWNPCLLFFTFKKRSFSNQHKGHLGYRHPGSPTTIFYRLVYEPPLF